MAYPWSANDILTAADLNAAIATVPVSTLGAWTAYTPTWNGTLGNGALAGRWLRAGRWIRFSITLAWGTTTTGTASAWTFTVPVASLSTPWVGGGRLIDASTGSQYYRHAFLNNTTVIALAAEDASTFVANTVPFTWANLDTLQIQGSYESAA